MAAAAAGNYTESDGKQRFLIRQMKPSDIEPVLALWAQIGLHEGTHTIQSFASVDPQGFYVTVMMSTNDHGDGDEEGEIIGCVAGVQVHPDLGHFLGLYAVRPDLQGRGLGVKMWNYLMDHHVQPAKGNAGLYAVPEHLHTYRDRAGFRVQDPDRNMVVHMSKPGSRVDTSKLVRKMGNVDVHDILTGSKVVDDIGQQDKCLIQHDIESRVTEYDRSVTGIGRDKLLSNCFREPDSLSFAAINKFDKQVTIS